LLPQNIAFEVFKKKYYSKNNKLFFDDEDIELWFKFFDKNCSYCGVSSEELADICTAKNINITLKIRRRDPKSAYSVRNCVLTCTLCNRAKSNLISDKDWDENFVINMRNYYKKILKRSLCHKRPYLVSQKRSLQKIFALGSFRKFLYI
jgi:5-methylcytosine-specific restriction endonuclease McrA